MSKVLAVFGATGQQGSSVIDFILNSPDLSAKYKLRAVTRSVDSGKAKALKNKGIEVVAGEVSNRSSLGTALTGAHYVFAMTVNSFGPNGLEVEYNSAKAIADVAIEKGAEYIVFSTLPSLAEVSGGKYTKVIPFEAKAKAEKYIRGLPIKSSFYAPGNFMQNFRGPTGPQRNTDGIWELAQPTSSRTPWALIDAVGDSGKFVGAILSDPEKYEGKTLCAAKEIYTSQQMADTFTKVTGKTVVHRQVPLAEYKNKYAFMGAGVDILIELFQCQEEFGYFGPETDKLVAWAGEQALGKLSTFEEYLKANPVELE